MREDTMATATTRSAAPTAYTDDLEQQATTSHDSYR
jgi:hypothetical protein